MEAGTDIDSVAVLLVRAEQELDAFERQPPLGARAYIRGRNARRTIIVELQEELDHA